MYLYRCRRRVICSAVERQKGGGSVKPSLRPLFGFGLWIVRPIEAMSYTASTVIDLLLPLLK